MVMAVLFRLAFHLTDKPFQKGKVKNLKIRKYLKDCPAQ